MEELIAQALREFNIEPRNISKHKLYYICHTDKGVKLLKQAVNDKEDAVKSINFQHEVKENLFLNGFKFVDRFNLSVKNTPFCILDGKVYTLTDHLPYRAADFSDSEEFKNILSRVAVMHSFKLPHPENIPASVYPDVKKQYIKDLDLLKAFKKRISKYSRLSDFDVLFYKNYDYYIDCLDKWYAISKEINYTKLFETVIKNGYICHNLLKEEYILVNNADIYITNFSSCSYGHYISDLGSLIKRHFKINLRDSLNLNAIIEIYNESHALTRDEIKLLYAMLIYPDKFIKMSTQFYTKNRSWIPGSFKSRMEATVQTKDFFMKYINEIYEEFVK